MPTTRAIRITAPTGGVLKSTAYEKLGAGFLVDARDMWGVDPTNNRELLAVRAAFATYGSQQSVKMIASVNVASAEDSDRVLITADGTTVYHWSSGSKTAATMTNSIANTSRNFQAASYLTDLYIADDSNIKKYTHSTTTVATATASAGTLPTNCRLICTWGARLVLSGDTSNPHVVYFSAVDAPLDFDYTAETTGAAISVSAIMEPVTALIPHTRDCLVVGTHSSLWIFSGNPTNGGQLYKLPGSIGPINGSAWCKDNKGRIWMMTRNGLAYMEGECGSFPVEVSRDIIPESLRGLDGINDKAYIEYDTLFRCLHIYVEGTNAQYFHYFLPRGATDPGSFWPITTPGEGILAIGRFDPLETDDVSGVLIGTAANLKRLDRTVFGGSSAAYATWVAKLTRSPAEKAKLRDVVATLADSTNDTTGTLDFHTAESVEAVAALPVARKASVTIENLQDSRRSYINLSGHALAMKYTQGDTSKKCAFEQFDATLGLFGKERVA